MIPKFKVGDIIKHEPTLGHNTHVMDKARIIKVGINKAGREYHGYVIEVLNYIDQRNTTDDNLWRSGYDIADLFILDIDSMYRDEILKDMEEVFNGS